MAAPQKRDPHLPPVDNPDPAVELRSGELQRFGAQVWAQAVHYVALHSALTDRDRDAALAANPYRLDV